MNPIRMQIDPFIIQNKINHQSVTKDFINKFTNGLNFGISFVDAYFSQNCLCSLYVYQNQSQSMDLFEITGYANLRNKFSNMGIRIFKYVNFVQTSQPIGENSLLVTVTGQANINDKIHNFESAFILKRDILDYLVTNYIVQFFI